MSTTAGRLGDPPGAVSDALPMKAFVTCGLASLAGLMFGLDIGVISGALDFIGKAFQVGSRTQEWIVSVMMAGAAAGAAFAGTLSYKLGRKKSLLIGAVLFIAGALLCAFAGSVTMLMIGRVVLGLAIGIVAFTGPLYISEVAPAHWRGAMVSLYQLMVTVGIFAAFVSDSLLTASGNWRLMLGIIAVPGAVFLLAVLFLPESPRWFLLRGRDEEARTVLNTLRGDRGEVDREIAGVREQLSVRQLGSAMFRQNPNFRRSVYLGIGLQVVQQLTGINVIMYYAPKIFGLAGFGAGASNWATAVVGLTNVFATLLAIGFADRWGRKPMLTVCFVTMAIGMAAVGILLSMGVHSDASRYLLVAMVLIFIIGFAAAPGPLIWTLCSEIQPLQGRDFGVAVSTFTNWAANWLVGNTFLTLLSVLGQSHTFWLFAILNAGFILFIVYLVPETKGVSLESIEHKLLAGEPLRRIGR
jgi:SP family galactose:H+ symporter-like MFS transporter